MRNFRLHSADGWIGKSREEDLEKLLCTCGGQLKIEKTKRVDFETRISHRLRCKKCKGMYGAFEILKKDTLTEDTLRT